MKALRPDLEVHPLRGNVDTRLRKLEEGEYDAVILAAAGLNRLGKTELVKQVIPAEVMCPAAGQGALGIEIRAGDETTRQLILFLNDNDARAATTCERALLNKLGGGCQVPIGAFAEVRMESYTSMRWSPIQMARKSCANRARAAIRCNWEKRWARPFCAAAATRFSSKSMDGALPRLNNREERQRSCGHEATLRHAHSCRPREASS